MLEPRRRTELGEWCGLVLGQLNERFPPPIRRLYQPEASLPHYRTLADRLHERFDDLVLAKSAFLHGIQSQELRHLPDGLLEPPVLAVLKEREKLRALNARDPDIREQLLTNVLPELREARAIALYVLEQLDHLDHEEKLFEWSAQFHKGPRQPPPELQVRFKNAAGLVELGRLVGAVLAPTAEYFGLWRERNTLEDANLYYFDRPRFDEILALALEAAEPGGECERLCGFVSASLVKPSLTGLIDIRWEWRHIGGFAQKILLEQQRAEDKKKSFKRALSKAGFVTVVCEDEESCYRALFRIHASFRYSHNAIRDHLGRPNPNGYRALHTTLAIDGESPGLHHLPETVIVRLLPRNAIPARFVVTGRAHLESLEKRLASDSRLGIRVFAPDGRGLTLPVGATVLEFACALNHKWLAHLAGATVNRMPASLLQRLGPGDVVWLDISQDDFLPLPRGWQGKVTSADAIRRITREFKAHFRPFLVSTGREFLRDKLRRREGIEHLPEDGELDSFIEDAAAALDHFNKNNLPKAALLLHSFGVIAFQGRGAELPFKSDLDDSLAMRLVKETANAIRGRKCLVVNDFDLSEDLRIATKGIVLCTECRPSLEKPLVGKLQGDILKLHRVGCDCGAGGVATSRLRVVARPQFFVIELNNQFGIASSIFDVFRRCEANITEFVGMEAGGRRWAVIRIKTDRINQTKVGEIMKELQVLPGLIRISPPDEGETTYWERPLPPRSREEWITLPQPYVCGSDIIDDAYFYGMREARANLKQVFAEAIYPDARQGRMAFINGPKRAGKTSLAKFFLRDLERNIYQPCLTAYYETPQDGVSWSEAERSIYLEILRRARNLANRNGVAINWEASRGMNLVELLRYVQHKLNCLVALAIDEATGLFQKSVQAGEAGKLAALCSDINSVERCLVLWVGPTSTTRYLPPSLRDVLHRITDVRVTSLTLPETKGLLKAEQLGRKYCIRIPHRLVEEVYRLTAGNPYWISFLGKEMWAKSDKKGEKVVYGMKMLSDAIDIMFQAKYPFNHCLADLGSAAAKGWASTILGLLSSSSTSEDAGELSLVSMREGLRNRGVELSGAELERVLDELRAQGSVREIRRRGDERMWTISAPLLAQFLRYCGSADAA